VNREDVLEVVRSFVLGKLGVDEEDVTEEATFIDDLGADALDFVELIMTLEADLHISIPDEDIAALGFTFRTGSLKDPNEIGDCTVGALVDCVMKLL